MRLTGRPRHHESAAPPGAVRRRPVSWRRRALRLGLGVGLLLVAVSLLPAASAQVNRDPVVDESTPPPGWLEVPNPFGETIVLAPAQAAIIGGAILLFLILTVRSFRRAVRARDGGDAHANIAVYFEAIDRIKDINELEQLRAGVAKARADNYLRAQDHAMVQKRIDVRKGHLQRNPTVMLQGTKPAGPAADGRSKAERELAELAGIQTRAAPTPQVGASSGPGAFGTPSAQLAAIKARHQMNRRKLAEQQQRASGRAAATAPAVDPLDDLRSELLGGTGIGGLGAGGGRAHDPLAALEPDDDEVDPGGVSGIDGDPLGGGAGAPAPASAVGATPVSVTPAAGAASLAPAPAHPGAHPAPPAATAGDDLDYVPRRRR